MPKHSEDASVSDPDFGEAPPADPVLCLVTGTHWYRWILIDPDTDTAIGYFAKQEAAVAELVSRVGYLPDEDAE